MNLLRVSLTAATHKTFCTIIRGFATAGGNWESEQVVEEMKNRSSPNKTTYTCLIDVFCKQDNFDMAYSVMNQMIDNKFFPSFVTLNDVLRGFLRINDMRNAYEMRNEMYRLIDERTQWMDVDTKSLFYQGVSNEVNYISLINAYLDEGNYWYNAERLFDEMSCLEDKMIDDKMVHVCCLPDSVLYSVFINGLDNNARTIEIKKKLLRFNYVRVFHRPILEYHRTLAEKCNDGEFKSLVELVEGFCFTGFKNAYDIILKLDYYKPNRIRRCLEGFKGFKIDFDYKPNGIDDGIIYNLFIIAHCKRYKVDDPYGKYKEIEHYNVDEAYNMFKEMVHYGFAFHMFTVFALIKTLKRKNMVNDLLWVIQNVLRSCNLNDSEIVKFLDEFNPEEPDSEALFDVLAEKAKDGLFLKCSYAPPSA